VDEHVTLGAGDEPSLVLAVGSRGAKGLKYPVDEAAVRHGARVENETDSPHEAYSRFTRLEESPPPSLP
jgi:hypothetical protein